MTKLLPPDEIHGIQLKPTLLAVKPNLKPTFSNSFQNEDWNHWLPTLDGF
jgi:hypothetical protein